ncbi:MAG TPA: ABC transporter permease [Candidatus Acidoferrum sp.]|nr:ABC transporter permease [Candidatus Acidoferrum sp.]
MRHLASLRSVVSALFRRSSVEKDTDEELRAHVQNRADDLERSGLTRADAERRARIEFGAHEKFKEECREATGTQFLRTLFQDLRFGLRMLRKNPGFTAVALLTIAIGIGANAAVFSVVNSVLLKPLNYPHSDELVFLHQIAPGAAGLTNFENGLLLSPSMYFTYAENNRGFQSLGVWTTDISNVTGVAEPEQVRAVVVSDGVLQSLGVAPQLGRWLTAADQTPRGPQRVLLSYGYWQTRFGGDRGVIGRKMMIDSQTSEIVGVMPREFRFVDTDFELIETLQFDRGKLILAGFGFRGIARLKTGTTIAQANADVARMLPIWMDTWSNGPGLDPHIYEKWRITPMLRPLKQEVIGNVSELLWIVMGTIGVVMLIACLNVANLMLVRVEARRQELAVRAALGAGWWRIVCGLLVESVALGLLGGVLGVGLGCAGVRFLVAAGPANLPRLSEISIDARTLSFTFALSVLSGLLFGLIPALKYAGQRSSVKLQSPGRTVSVSRERLRARHLLVVGQVAMALVLLVSAGLMIRTFQALRTVDPGLTDARHLQLMRIGIPNSLIPETQKVMRAQNEILDQLAAIPGVKSAAFANQMPMEGFGSGWDTIFVEGKTYHKGDIPPLYLYKQVAPGFLATAGTRLIAGRDLTWNDVYGLRPVVMISENLARQEWSTPANAIGKRLTEDLGLPWREVVGVIQDVPEKGVQEKAPETVYWPPMVENLLGRGPAQPIRVVTFVIRSERAGTQAFLDEVRRAVWSANANLPLASVRTMQQVYDKSLVRTSFTLVMLAIASAMALLLGLIGIYGVISYTVSQRQREIGIRLALGAQQGRVMQMVLGQAAKMTLVGVLIGMAAALGLTRLMTSLLFGVTAHDPITLAGVDALLILVALLACYFPARRATRVDPMVALRHE